MPQALRGLVNAYIIYHARFVSNLLMSDSYTEPRRAASFPGRVKVTYIGSREAVCSLTVASLDFSS